MIVTLAEAKEYLRIDTDYDDTMIEVLLKSAQKLCADVARLNEKVYETKGDIAKVAVLYALGYLYENRAEADMHKLTLTLRSLLFSIRQETFSDSEPISDTGTTDTALTFAMFDRNDNLINSGIRIAGDEDIANLLDDTGFTGGGDNAG